jgi:hypothetical protein
MDGREVGGRGVYVLTSDGPNFRFAVGPFNDARSDSERRQVNRFTIVIIERGRDKTWFAALPRDIVVNVSVCL